MFPLCCNPPPTALSYSSAGGDAVGLLAADGRRRWLQGGNHCLLPPTSCHEQRWDQESVQHWDGAVIHSHHITVGASFTTLLISGTLSLSVFVTSPRGDRVILWDGERLVIAPHTTTDAWTNGGDLATAHGATSPTYVAAAANATAGAKAWFQFELAHGTEERTGLVAAAIAQSILGPAELLPVADSDIKRKRQRRRSSRGSIR